MTTIDGTGGNDTLIGTAGPVTLNGGDGNDDYIVNSQTTYIVDSSGTDAARVNADFVKIPSYIENVTYRSGVQPLPYWIDALLPDEANGKLSVFTQFDGSIFKFRDGCLVDGAQSQTPPAFWARGV